MSSASAAFGNPHLDTVLRDLLQLDRPGSEIPVPPRRQLHRIRRLRTALRPVTHPSRTVLTGAAAGLLLAAVGGAGWMARSSIIGHIAANPITPSSSAGSDVRVDLERRAPDRLQSVPSVTQATPLRAAAPLVTPPPSASVGQAVVTQVAGVRRVAAPHHVAIKQERVVAAAAIVREDPTHLATNDVRVAPDAGNDRAGFASDRIDRPAPVPAIRSEPAGEQMVAQPAAPSVRVGRRTSMDALRDLRRQW